MRIAISPHLTNTCYLFDHSHPSGCEVLSHGGFDLHFPMTNDVEQVFMCLMAIYISSLEKYLLLLLLNI